MERERSIMQVMRDLHNKQKENGFLPSPGFWSGAFCMSKNVQ